jgi:hypothetical protein
MFSIAVKTISIKQSMQITKVSPVALRRTHLSAPGFRQRIHGVFGVILTRSLIESSFVPAGKE